MIVRRIRGKLSELFCAVLCTIVVHNDTFTHMRSVLKDVGLGLVFVVCLSLPFLVFFSGLA